MNMRPNIEPREALSIRLVVGEDRDPFQVSCRVGDTTTALHNPLDARAILRLTDDYLAAIIGDLAARRPDMLAEATALPSPKPTSFEISFDFVDFAANGMIRTASPSIDFYALTPEAVALVFAVKSDLVGRFRQYLDIMIDYERAAYEKHRSTATLLRLFDKLVAHDPEKDPAAIVERIYREKPSD